MTHISNGKSKGSNGKKAPQPVAWHPASRSDITGKMRSEHESHRKITRAAAVAEGDDLIQFPQSQIVDESVSPSLREASRFLPSPRRIFPRRGMGGVEVEGSKGRLDIALASLSPPENEISVSRGTQIGKSIYWSVRGKDLKRKMLVVGIEWEQDMEG